jgi:hypothetical protein
MKFLVLAIALGGCSYEESLGRGHLEPGGPPVSLVDAGPDPDLLGGPVAYSGLAGGLLDTPGGLLFLGCGGPCGRIDTLMALTDSGAARLAAIPYELRTETLAYDDAATYVAVHFSDSQGDGIIAIAHDTHEIRVVTSGRVNVDSIAIDAGRIYFIEKRGQGQGTLSSISIAGDGEALLANGLDAPGPIFVDDAYAYFTDLEHQAVYAAGTSPPYTRLVLATNLTVPHRAVAHEAWIYVTERGLMQDDGRVLRVRRPAPGARQEDVAVAVETLASGVAIPLELTIDASHVYWTSYMLGLQRVAVAGGAVETVLPSYIQGCGPMARHDDVIYFTARYPSNQGSLIYEARIAP